MFTKIVPEEGSSMKVKVTKMKNPIFPLSLKGKHSISLTNFDIPRPNLRSVKTELFCSCPEIIICDDDLTQHFFYKKTLSRFKLKPNGISYNITGSQAIEEFKRTKKCLCASPRLIITDYDMGCRQLDGLITARILRDLGYRGPIIMRSACETDEIKVMTRNFKPIDETLNHFVSKGDHLGFLKLVELYISAHSGHQQIYT